MNEGNVVTHVIQPAAVVPLSCCCFVSAKDS